MSNFEDDLDLAIQELQIKTDNSMSDRQQLYRILFDILGYPMITQALIHERANFLGKNDLMKTQQYIEKQIQNRESYKLKVCKCCGILQQNESLQCNTHLKDINLGLGIKLYFMSLSYHAVVFTIASIMYSIYTFITNLQYSQQNNFEKIYCNLKGTCNLARIGFGPKATINTLQTQDASFIQIVLSIAFIIIWSLINIYRVHNEKITEIENKNRRLSASDFTLLLEHVPKKYLEKSKDEVLKEFNQAFKKYEKITNSYLGYKVVKVNVGRGLYYSQTKMSQKKQFLIKEMEKRQQVFRSWINHRRSHKEFPLAPELREQFYEEYIQFYIEQYDTKQFHEVELQEQNTVFVTMKSSMAKNQIVALNEPSSIFNMFKICRTNYEFPIEKVIIGNAPEPEEIVWKNIGFEKYKKTMRKLSIYLVALVLISISLGVSIALGFVQTNQGEAYISILISIVITSINFIIEYLIQAISSFENQYNKTAQQASIAFKIGLSQLLNSVGVPMVVSYIAGKKVYESGGMVTDVFFLGLFNILTPIGRFIDPYYLYLNCKEIYYNSPDERLKMFGQQKLNQYYASYEMELGYEYSYVIRTVIFTSFFMCLQPIIAIFAPIGLGLMYMVNKYKLYYRFHRPKFHNSHVNDVINGMLAIGPAFFALGHLYCFFWIKETQVTSTQIQLSLWISIAIASFVIIFVFKIFYCCMKQPTSPDLDYFDRKAVLMSDYDLLNPTTKHQAICEMEDYFGELERITDVPNRWQLLRLTLFDSMVTSNRIASLKNQIQTSRNYSKDFRTNNGSREIQIKEDRTLSYNKYNKNNNKTEVPLSQNSLIIGTKELHLEEINHCEQFHKLP